MRHLAVSAAATWAVGLVGILCDFLQGPELAGIGLRSLFGAAVCATLWIALISADGLPGTRLVSRWTYILLYGLALVRAGLYLWTPAHPPADFQFYIAACVVPLWVIRGVVTVRHSFAVQH